MKIALKANDISFQYPDNDELTLKNISFELYSGEALGVLGPNGGGKTTLMKILSGMLRPTSGTLNINNDEINQRHFPHHLVSYIPQSNMLNLSMPMSAMEYLTYASNALGIKNANDKIQEITKKVGINHKLNYQFRNMSGGEKQRVLLAKSLLTDPKILLLDEPTKGLDSLGQDQLLNLLKEIQNISQAAVVIVDHNINQIIRHCDKVICLNRTSHWHDHKELLTKNVLENIYHCEFEHLLIHENEAHEHDDHTHSHEFCNHDHPHSHSHTTNKHKYILRNK